MPYWAAQIKEKFLTTGAWNNSDPSVNYYSYKSWSGTDRPKVKYSKDEMLRRYRDGLTYSFRLRHPKWSRPPKRVLDTPHPYDMDAVLHRDQFISFLDGHGQPASGWVFAGFCQGFFGSARVLVDSNDELKLLGKLREKLTGSEFNPSLFLGEGHQTLNLLADSAIRIRKAYTHLRRGDIAGTARSLFEGTSRAPLKPYKDMKQLRNLSSRNLANSWIELQYGWLPLLNDAEACAQTLAHKLSVPLQQSVRVAIRREQVLTNGQGPSWNQWQWKSYNSQSIRLVVQIKENISAPFELGVLNPEIVAWELMPWSFAADWFLPIGQYLEARAVTSAIVGTYIRSDKQIGHLDVVIHPTDLPSALISTEAKLLRTVSGAPTLPLPKFKSLAKAASWQHCANAIALLTQQFVGAGGKRYH